MEALPAKERSCVNLTKRDLSSVLNNDGNG